MLKHCHVTRQIDAAQKSNFLKKNQGRQAWAHSTDVTNESAKSFGKIGFKSKLAKTETQPNLEQSDCFEKGEKSVYTVSAHKPTVLRKAISLPRNFEFLRDKHQGN